METLQRLRDTLSDVLGAFDVVRAAAEEALQYREVLKDGHKPISFADMVLAVRHSQDEALSKIADALARMDVKVFRLGTLRALALDGYDWAAINFVKQQLEQFLSDTYAVPFKVVVNHSIKD